MDLSHCLGLVREKARRNNVTLCSDAEKFMAEMLLDAYRAFETEKRAKEKAESLLKKSLEEDSSLNEGVLKHATRISEVESELEALRQINKDLDSRDFGGRLYYMLECEIRKLVPLFDFRKLTVKAVVNQCVKVMLFHQQVANERDLAIVDRFSELQAKQVVTDLIQK